MKKQRLSLAVLFVLGLSVESWASLHIATEVGNDAGNTIPTAFVLPGGTTSIDGEIDSNQDTDLFKFTLSAAATFSIEVLEISPALDMNLIVFNSLGQGLAGNDDNTSGGTPVTVLGFLDSLLTLSLAAGDYFFAVGDNNMGAFVSVAAFNSSSDFIEDDSGILGSPTTETLGLVGPEGGPGDLNDVGFYRVNFSQAVDAMDSGVIPEPTAFAVWSLLGLTVAGARRRRA